MSNIKERVLNECKLVELEYIPELSIKKLMPIITALCDELKRKNEALEYYTKIYLEYHEGDEARQALATSEVEDYLDKEFLG